MNTIDTGYHAPIQLADKREQKNRHVRAGAPPDPGPLSHRQCEGGFECAGGTDRAAANDATAKVPASKAERRSLLLVLGLIVVAAVLFTRCAQAVPV